MKPNRVLRNTFLAITRIACVLLIGTQFSHAQDDDAAFTKVDESQKRKLNLTYEYEFKNADSSEGVEKAFREGKLVVETYFRDRGQFQFVKQYSAKTGKVVKSDTIVNMKKIVGSSISYFPSGSVKEVEIRDTSGALTGYKGYYDGGKKKIVIGLANGKRNGPFIEYNPNGTVKESGNYLNDQRHGVFKFYDIRGNALASKKFVNGKIAK
jgi:antitoxin component YwqK of YwqJK toxin-antitoxin module